MTQTKSGPTMSGACCGRRRRTWVASGRLAQRERLAAEGGDLLTEIEQYAKLALVSQVARATWGK